jgi:hypothetical protein
LFFLLGADHKKIKNDGNATNQNEIREQGILPVGSL